MWPGADPVTGPQPTRPQPTRRLPTGDEPLLPRWMARFAASDPAAQAALKLRCVRILIVLNLLLTTSYLGWRSLYTVNWVLWPLSLALLGAELFSLTDTWLFCVGMWRIKARGAPPTPPVGATVDVFITCYNEPVELVRETARAARDIHYPHHTWVLDDGDNAEMRAMAEAEGVRYVVRGERWIGRDRHAKAGNLINALYLSEGQFFLVLDADQVPLPQILDRTLGYFDDPKVAFVQTPQWFKNVAPGDPFGVDAPLFYGPIQQGKDGWNSAFFCGSNAVLRRDSLMLVGLKYYAREMEARMRRLLWNAEIRLRVAWLRMSWGSPEARRAIGEVLTIVREARRDRARPLQEITWRFQRRLDALSHALMAGHSARIQEDLGVTPGVTALSRGHGSGLAPFSARGWSPLGAVAEIRTLFEEIDLHRDHEAEPIFPMATISVTEDMATAMRLHAAGFDSVYHHEVLAVGVAPEDLRTALQQRLRWAQGTMQVFLRENPLWQPGLSLPQRLMYLGTMWTYLSGYATVVYLFAPILYLLLGWLPVVDVSGEFLLRLVPCLIINQLLFLLIGYGLPTLRGQQYSLALFPLWITAVSTAFANVYLGGKLGFVVTPKTRQGGVHWALIRPQLGMVALMGLAALVGVGRLVLGDGGDTLAVVLNILWILYGVWMLSVIIFAAQWHPPTELKEPP